MSSAKYVVETLSTLSWKGGGARLGARHCPKRSHGDQISKEVRDGAGWMG